MAPDIICLCSDTWPARCGLCRFKDAGDALTEDDWRISAFYDRVREYLVHIHNHRESTEEKTIITELPDVQVWRIHLETYAVPRRDWPAFMDGARFLFALERNLVDVDAYTGDVEDSREQEVA